MEFHPKTDPPMVEIPEFFIQDAYINLHKPVCFTLRVHAILILTEMEISKLTFVASQKQMSPLADAKSREAALKCKDLGLSVHKGVDLQIIFLSNLLLLI